MWYNLLCIILQSAKPSAGKTEVGRVLGENYGRKRVISLDVKKVDVLGREISRLGFGCMRLPLNEDGTIDRAESARMVDRAYKVGVNYFDTAYGYHNRESQLFIGEALKKYPRESFNLATKLPIWLCNGKRELVAEKFTEQLEACQVDYFDFYLVHALDQSRYDEFVASEAHAYLTEQKAAGKIGLLGFSYHGDYETFVKLLDNFEWDFVQIQINYIDDVMSKADAYYKQLCDRDIACVVMEPVRGGALANPPQVALDEMKALDEGLTPASWALRWCIDKDNMKIILSGMSTMEQVDDNLRTFSEFPEKLSADESAMIDRARDHILAIKTVPCTGCCYCMDCPFGVDIPEVFALYNQYKLFNNAFRTSNNYAAMIEKGHGADLCTQCGACVSMCPQSIAIPERLAEVHEEISKL